MVYVAYLLSGKQIEFFGISKDAVFLAAKELYPHDPVQRVCELGDW
jgi:hypothetical protein